MFSEEEGETIKVIDFGTSEQYDPSKSLNQQFGTYYYMAPEVLSGSYDARCDLWSVGAIMYVLLTGCVPYSGENDEEIKAKVKKGKYRTSLNSFTILSSDAKDLIQKLMKKNQKSRLTADEALEHPWFEGKESTEDNSALLNEALSNFKHFRAEAKLQQAALSFIVTQLSTKEQLAELEKTFKELDLNKDGKLSKEEVLVGYQKIKGDTAEKEVEDLFAIADTDGSGSIEYSEWVVATVQKDKMLDEDKLTKAFRLFDLDNSGLIKADEL